MLLLLLLKIIILNTKIKCKNIQNSNFARTKIHGIIPFCSLNHYQSCLNYELKKNQTNKKNNQRIHYWRSAETKIQKNIFVEYKSPWTTHNSIKVLSKSPTVEWDSMHSTSGFSEILLVTAESRCHRHVAPLDHIRLIFVTLQAKSHLINGFCVVGKAS